MINKNYNREPIFSFANINLLGHCNADCFFCLGKDIKNELHGKNQVGIHYSLWDNLPQFILKCKSSNVNKIYLTGQNTDSLMYEYFPELRDFIQEQGFEFGIRTNGFLAEQKMPEIIKCNGEIGLSVNTLIPDINYKILGRNDIPKWGSIIPQIKNCRVSIVINRYNVHEFFSIVKYLSQFKNLKYIQARRISTDTREDILGHDIAVFEDLYEYVKSINNLDGNFHLAQTFTIYGMEVNFWRTVETSINSINYFTDGTISDEYFVVEGYLKNRRLTN